MTSVPRLRPRPALRPRARSARGVSRAHELPSGPTCPRTARPHVRVPVAPWGVRGASGPARHRCRLPVAGVPPHPERERAQPPAGPGAVEGRRGEVRAPAGETLRPLRAAAGRTASRRRPGDPCAAAPPRATVASGTERPVAGAPRLPGVTTFTAAVSGAPSALLHSVGHARYKYNAAFYGSP